MVSLKVVPKSYSGIKKCDVGISRSLYSRSTIAPSVKKILINKDFSHWNTGKNSFIITAPLDHSFNKVDSTLSGGFHVNLSFSGPVVWIGYQNNPTLFLHFCDYLPSERTRPNLNSFHHVHTRMICIKFDWNWPANSGKISSVFSVYFYSFAIIFPWKRECPSFEPT
jgi:hypothetical protein